MGSVCYDKPQVNKTKIMKKTKARPVRRPTKAKKTKHQKAKLVIRRSRPIHKRVLLHPITVFLLLCVGVFIVMWTYRAAADTVNVTAKVPAAALTSGALIAEPLDGTTFTTSPIHVKGSCPTDSYVVLLRNSAMSGSAICDISNTFDVETGLYPGTNTLQAQAYNLTDDAGPVTGTINVIYNPPVIPGEPAPPATTTPGNTTVSATSEPGVGLPLISSDYSYQTFEVGSLFEWTIDISGGTAPYRITTNWGDGSIVTQVVPDPQKVVLSHTYEKSNDYTVKITVTDAKGAKSFLQIFAIIRIPGVLNLTSSLTGGGGEGGILNKGLLLVARNWLVFAWGSYATVSLMAISFWLGERQQISLISSLKHIPGRHKHI